MFNIINQHIYLPSIVSQCNFTELFVKKLIQGGGDKSKCVHACWLVKSLKALKKFQLVQVGKNVVQTISAILEPFIFQCNITVKKCRHQHFWGNRSGHFKKWHLPEITGEKSWISGQQPGFEFLPRTRCPLVGMIPGWSKTTYVQLRASSWGPWQQAANGHRCAALFDNWLLRWNAEICGLYV